MAEFSGPAETPETSGTPGAAGTPESLTRRGVVTAAGGAGLGAVLTACGSSKKKDTRMGADGTSADGSSGSSDTASAPATPSASAAPSTSAAPATSASGPQPAGGGPELAKTSDIPVGGGRVFPDQQIVVTQPTAGHFKGFSSTCTHRGCTVAGVAGGTINCPCHGSMFHIADGSVAHGPATSPLPAKAIKVSGNEITLA